MALSRSKEASKGGKESSIIVNAAAFQDHRKKSVDLSALPCISNVFRPKAPAVAKQNSAASTEKLYRDVWVCEACTWENVKGNNRAPLCGGCFTLRKRVSRAPTLAQRRGLVPGPLPKLSVEEWKQCEQRAMERGDASEPCAICRDHLGVREHVILSCTHMFHLSCIRSFERFVRASQRVCPLCRKSDYEKKMTTQANVALRVRCATVIQSLVRGHLARKRCYELWLMFYRKGYGDRSRRRQFLANRVSKKTNQLLEAMTAKHHSIDSFLNELDQTISLSRRIFDRQGDHDGKKNVQCDTQYNWEICFAKARDRGEVECPICMSEFSNSMSDVSILSCSHLLHQDCLRAFETFNIYDVLLCPVCRSGYETRSWIVLANLY